MIIGIDLDNTIINYNKAFTFAALDLGLVPDIKSRPKEDFGEPSNGKTWLKKILLSEDESGYKWQFLQGQVYGNYIYMADLFPGVANFLIHCAQRSIRVAIVSHKTEFGHHDKKKTSLRGAALNFLENESFFLNDCLLKKSDIFFLNTRFEKINKINELGCNYFIDDLPEVLNDPIFPEDTNPILFGMPSENLSTTCFRSWFGISRYFFGCVNPEDIGAYVKHITEQKVEKVEQIRGRGNSTIYKITMQSEEKFAAKLYPDPTFDPRPRLETERKAYSLFNSNHVSQTPRLVATGGNLNFSLFEWVNGLSIDKPSQNDLDSLISFVKSLIDLSQKTPYDQFNLASAACLSGKDIENQIYDRYTKIKNIAHKHDNLKCFLEKDLEQTIENFIKYSKSSWFGSFSSCLQKSDQILSPSDLGFHNVIKSDIDLKFIDFEYFGWDDPVKLTSDVLLHPGMTLTNEQKRYWVKNLVEIFSDDPTFRPRLFSCYILYGLCWCLILLNDFCEFNSFKRANASMTKQNKQKIQEKQIQKSRNILKTLVSVYHHGFPYE